MADENGTRYNGTNTLDLLSERGSSQINKLPVELMDRYIAINGWDDGALKDGIVVVIKSHWKTVRYEIVIK